MMIDNRPDKLIKAVEKINETMRITNTLITILIICLFILKYMGAK